MVMPREIVQQVRQVLVDASQGKGTSPNFLTAYQILDRLAPALRTQLITERTLGGAGAGTSYGAPSVVKDAAQMIPGIEIEYVDTAGLTVTVAG